MANLATDTVHRTLSTACRAALLAALLTATPVTAETEPATSTTIIGGNEMLAAGADALRDGDFQRGIELTLEGLKRPNAPRDVAAGLSNLCAGFVGVRQYDTALEKCNEALKIEATNWRTWNNRAAAYLAKGMYDAALRDVASGLEQAPESATLKKTRRIVLERQRAHEELKRDALKSRVRHLRGNLMTLFRSTWWVAPALVLAPIVVTHADITDEQVDQLARGLETRLVEWRRDFHQNPELSNREFKTSKKVEAHLRRLGLEVKTGIAHTGVVALLRGAKPGPTIALRADMDGLPVTERADVPFKSKVTAEYNGQTVGVMHACGHDTHIAILMAAAEVLSGLRRDLAGSVLFIFQPAEEGPPVGEEGGAPLMLKEGLFDTYRPDAVFGLHVHYSLRAGDVGYKAGPFMAASDRFSIVVNGRQTHGARPWQGVDPVVTAAAIVTSLQTVVSRQVDLTQNPAVVTVGTVKGGLRFNIIPDSVEMTGTIRTFDPAQRADIFERVNRVVQNVAEANGATATFAIGADGNPVTFNNLMLTEKVVPSLERALGNEHVKRIALETGAEDFAHFAQKVPGFYYFVGATPAAQNLLTTPANHSPLFYVDETALMVGLRSMLYVALDYLQAAPAAKTADLSP